MSHRDTARYALVLGMKTTMTVTGEESAPSSTY